MSAPTSHSQTRSSSPSPAGLLRRCSSSKAPMDHSPWRRSPAAGHAGGDRRGLARSSLSPFERSGRTTTTTHRIHKKAVPAEDDHTTDGYDDGNDDDYWMCDDEAFDDDGGGEDLSVEEARRSSWLRDFLARMGELKPEEVNDPAATTLCPACKGGPGRSQRYRGFQALLDHARSVRAKRVRLHRRFAEILEEELRSHRGRSEEGDSTSEKVTATDEKWEGLGGAGGRVEGRMIPWPPIVVLLNTRLGKQEGSGKWVGMGNRDLLNCFKEYEPVKARSAYGSYGHSGVSLLVFEASVLGYHQAERLHSQFIREGRGQYQWHKHKPWKQTTEKRLLYGYMATKEEELSIFSTHNGDKQKLKYEMKPYQVVVGKTLKEMYESSQKKALLEREIAKEVEQNKSLEEMCKQRGLEIEAIRRVLNEQSDEHNQEIESLNECNEILNNKLRESETERKKMQKQISSICSTGHDQDEASSSELQNYINLEDGDRHNKPDNEMDEIAEEQQYLGTCDSWDKKKKREASAMWNLLELIVKHA